MELAGTNGDDLVREIARESRGRVLGEHERGLVDFGAVVAEGRKIHRSGTRGRALRHLHARFLVVLFGANHETDLSAGVGRDGGVGVVDRAALENVLAHLRYLLDDGHVKPEALTLRADGAAGFERSVHQLEERPLEEDLSGANWVGGVDDNRVVRPLRCLSKVINTVADHKVESGVGEATGQLREELLRSLANAGVDFRHVDFFYAGVPSDFPNHPAIATAHHQHALWGSRNSTQRQVCDHFLVAELIAVSHLHHAVECEHRPEGVGLKDGQVLKLCSRLE
mmetsp:Transcript_16830/g.29999  ORF Transcript_16830/g.29999 Transcript_16830/m.29999 type:complete len:282 (-) Transcript_16830:379-1224(-)